MKTLRAAALLAVVLSTSTSIDAADKFILSVAKTAGANGTFFQTDLRIVNLDSTEATIDLFYLPLGSDNRGAQRVSLTIPARQSREIADVLGTQFALTGTLGALRLSSQSSFVATSRTYTLSADPASCPGTFGQFAPAFDLGDASARSILANIIFSPSLAGGFRTNVGLVNPTEAGVTVNLTLRSGQGASLRTQSVTLLPLQHYQLALTLLFSTGELAASNAFIELSAPVPFFAYASVIDNESGDPIFVPAEPDSGTPLSAISITARQWRFEPATIEVLAGQPVTIELRSIDVRHGFDVFGVGPVDCSTKVTPSAPCALDPGIPAIVTFTPSTKGTFEFRCTIECQSNSDGTAGHLTMSGTLIVK